MNFRSIIFVALAVVAIAAAWYVGREYSGPGAGSNESNPAESAGEDVVDTVHGQGRLEPGSGVIKVMAAPGERIDDLLVDQVGAAVKKDEVLAVLHSRKLRELELELARAKKQEAEDTLKLEQQLGEFKKQAANLAVDEAELAGTTVTTRAESLDILEKRLNLARETLARLQKLKSDPATAQLINQSEIDQQTRVVQQIEQQLLEAKSDLSIAKDQAERAKDTAQINLDSVTLSIDQADTQLPRQTLDQAIALAELALDMTQVKSPIDGQVLDVIVRAGDTVSNQPIMVLGNTDQMMCVAEIHDAQMKFVSVGAAATLTSDALNGPLTGRVVEKGVMIGPPSMKDPNPYARVDRKTGKVTILLDRGSAERASRFVNLQVEVEISRSPDPAATEQAD